MRTLIQQSLEELEDEGVELFTASNGEEALETIREEQPNLVFLDVMMPKKNGFDVCNTVKNELGLSTSTSSCSPPRGRSSIASAAGGGRRSLHDQALRSGRPGRQARTVLGLPTPGL
jgi:CheY-like chemotaxis protein